MGAKRFAAQRKLRSAGFQEMLEDCSETGSRGPAGGSAKRKNAETVVRATGGTDIWTACKVGDLTYVKQTAKNFPELLYLQMEGRTPLYHACHCGHIEVVTALLNAGCTDDTLGTCYQSALTQEIRSLLKRYTLSDEQQNESCDAASGPSYSEEVLLDHYRPEIDAEVIIKRGRSWVDFLPKKEKSSKSAILMDLLSKDVALNSTRQTSVDDETSSKVAESTEAVKDEKSTGADATKGVIGIAQWYALAKSVRSITGTTDNNSRRSAPVEVQETATFRKAIKSKSATRKPTKSEISAGDVETFAAASWNSPDAPEDHVDVDVGKLDVVKTRRDIGLLARAVAKRNQMRSVGSSRHANKNHEVVEPTTASPDVEVLAGTKTSKASRRIILLAQASQKFLKKSSKSPAYVVSEEGTTVRKPTYFNSSLKIPAYMSLEKKVKDQYSQAVDNAPCDSRREVALSETRTSIFTKKRNALLAALKGIAPASSDRDIIQAAAAGPSASSTPSASIGTPLNSYSSEAPRIPDRTMKAIFASAKKLSSAIRTPEGLVFGTRERKRAGVHAPTEALAASTDEVMPLSSEPAMQLRPSGNDKQSSKRTQKVKGSSRRNDCVEVTLESFDLVSDEVEHAEEEKYITESFEMVARLAPPQEKSAAAERGGPMTAYSPEPAKKKPEGNKATTTPSPTECGVVQQILPEIPSSIQRNVAQPLLSPDCSISTTLLEQPSSDDVPDESANPDYSTSSSSFDSESVESESSTLTSFDSPEVDNEERNNVSMIIERDQSLVTFDDSSDSSSSSDSDDDGSKEEDSTCETESCESDDDKVIADDDDEEGPSRRHDLVRTNSDLQFDAPASMGEFKETVWCMLTGTDGNCGSCSF